jgi:iron complex outermembrane receptor protein
MTRRLKILILIIFGLSLVPAVLKGVGDGTEIRGRVTTRNGEPLQGAHIAIVGSNTGVSTGNDGTYSITDLKPGSYTLRFSFIGFETQLHTVKLETEIVLDVILTENIMMTSDVIIKATRAGEHTPLTFTDISRDMIRQQNSGQDIPYLLSLTPSLVETSEAGNGIGYTNLRIRGTDASRINVTIDGIPLNDPESQQVFWVDLPDLASSVDNIQVQRGVGTSSNGAGAFGASINIQTRGIESSPYAEINTTAGSYNTFKGNLEAGTGLLKDKFGFQMRLSDIRSDGYIERTGSKHTSAYLSGIYRTEKSLLKVNILLGKEHTGIGWWGVPAEMLDINRRFNPAGQYTDENGMTRYYNNESDNYTQNHFQLLFTRKFSDRVSLHTALHYTRGEGYYEEYKEDARLSDYGLPEVVIGGTVMPESDLIRRKWLSNDFYGIVYSLNYSDKRLEANFGGGMNYYAGDHFGTIIWMQFAGNTEKDHQWYFNTGDKGEVSFYGKMNYRLLPELRLFGDLQYRFIAYDMKGPDDDLIDLDQTHRYNFLNPKAGILYSFKQDREIFLSLSVANREPARADFKEAAGDEAAMPRPERLYDIEAGYKLKTGKISCGINLFDMIYKDQLVPTGELSNVGYPILTNVRRSYRAGVEVSVAIIPLPFIDWNFNFTLSRNRIPDFTEFYVDYNSSDGTSEYKSRMLGSVDIAYSPAVTGSSDLALILHPSLKLHLISKYVGKQYFDNTMSSVRMLEPYFTSNFRIDFEPVTRRMRGTEFQLLVNNIFNSQYISNAYGGNWFEDGIEKTWAYYFPQAGLNFLVRAGLNF